MYNMFTVPANILFYDAGKLGSFTKGLLGRAIENLIALFYFKTKPI